MKRDLKYISILVAMALFVITFKVLAPKPIDWTITFSHEDKDPFGSYLINERLGDIFPGQEINVVNQTIYELVGADVKNLLIISERFGASKEDSDALLSIAAGGVNVFIASQYYTGDFADTLGIDAEDYFFNDDVFNNFSVDDTASLSFVNPRLSKEEYQYSRKNTHNYFDRFDSLETTVIAVNDLKKPIMIKMPYGEGNIFLCSTPLAFTNNYLLYEQNYEFVSNALSYLPLEDVTWTEYYQLGRLEPSTPLRFLLSSPPLKWALYIVLISLILFMIFESKRKQRIIPIVTPLKNTTLEFISTISNLYLQKKDHKSIAEKRINFFLDQIRTHYFLKVKKEDAGFIDKLVQKSGNDKQEVQRLFAQISSIRNSANISEQELLSLSKRIDDFKIT